MDGINNLAYKAVTQVQETQDEFIFQTLSNFAARECHIIVEKEELAKAIQLIRMYREYGRDIDQCWSTATQQSAVLSDAYRRGYQKGRDDEHNRVVNILNAKKKRRRMRRMIKIWVDNDDYDKLIKGETVDIVVESVGKRNICGALNFKKSKKKEALYERRNDLQNNGNT